MIKIKIYDTYKLLKYIQELNINYSETSNCYIFYHHPDFEHVIRENYPKTTVLVKQNKTLPKAHFRIYKEKPLTRDLWPNSYYATKVY